jgi:hypothetical protein
MKKIACNYKNVRMQTHISFPVVKYYLFFGLLMWMVGCSSVAPVVKRTTNAKSSDFAVWTSDLRSDELKNSYRIMLKTPKNSITGLCILKKNGDEWRGTLINEMGAKAFDFIITDEKCELLNVISLMDKWYIKKTIAADLHFFFNVDNPKAPFQKRLERFEQQGKKVVNYQKKQISVRPDGAVLLVNKRHRLQYELRKMVEIDPDKVIL